MKKKLLAIFLSFLMVLNILIPTMSYAAEDNSGDQTSQEPIGHIVFDIEKTILGLGYVQEPIMVPIYEGQTGAEVVISVLGEENVSYSGKPTSSFYLSAIKDDDDTEIDGFSAGRRKAGWLGERDYSSYSGWMYYVNETAPNVGMSAYKPKDGDVMRLKFTAAGYGADTGSGAKRDALVTAVAKINSASNKSELLSYKNVRLAYKKANDAITTNSATQSEVDQALADLNKAVENVSSDSKATPMTGLTLDKTEAEVFRGEKIQLSATISPSNTTDDTTIKWKTSKSDVAKVDQNGLVTAKGVGTCKIYAYAGDFRAQFSITVKKDTSKKFEIEDGVLLRYNGDETEITIPDGVTAIDEDVFKDLSDVTSITMPDTVTSIGDYAFSNCKKLTSINIPNSVTSIGNYAFNNCSVLADVQLPTSLVSIGDNAFYACRKLTALKMPDGVKTIGNNAFYNCSGVTELTLNEGLESIGNNAFYSVKMKSLSIPSTVKKIGEKAFYYCSSITGEVVLPEGLTEISAGLFRNCSSITGIKIPESVTSIGDEAFYYCQKVENINIPSKVTTIGNSAFYSMDLVTNIDIPESTTTIGKSAFNSCSELQSLTISNNLSSIGESAFNYCSKLSSIKIKDKKYEEDSVYDLSSVTTIGGSAFSSNSSVENIILSKDLKKIPQNIFRNCSKLSTIELPISLESIDGSAFTGTNLTSITIPASVKSIDSSMVSGVKSLTEILVNEENTNYKSVDGVLYTKSGELVIYPEGKTSTELVVPDGTVKLTSTLNNKTKITKVIIPASVKEIDGNVFSGCTALQSIEVAQGNENFKAVDGVLYDKSGKTLLIYPAAKADTEYTILDGCTSLQSNSFRGNNNITTLNMPLSLETINSSAINYADELVNINMNEKATKIADNAFKSCSNLTNITYPDAIESIGDYAFNSTRITTLNIPQNVKSIGKNAFAGCSSIKSEIVIPEGITTINEYTFSGCSSIPSITIPEGVTEIGADAFYNCSSLTSIDIPSTVNKMGDYAFASCSKLSSIVVPDGVKEIPYRAFRYCSKLTSVKLPEGITTIGEGAFNNCSSLTEIDIPSTVTTLKGDAFSNCSVLNNVELPSNLQTMEYSIFYSCRNLTSIKIPKSVKTIGASVFRNCSNLSNVTIYSKDAEFGNTVFGNNSKDLTVYGYADSTAETYASSNSVKFVPFTSKVIFKADDIEIDEQGVAEGLTTNAPQAPVKEGYTFVGWFKDVNDVTTKFDAENIGDEDVTYTAKYAHVEMLGAQGKLIVNDKSGIRFGTKIYKDGDQIVEMGTIILPQNLLPEGTSLTLDTPKIAKSVANVLYESNEKENYVTYLGSIVNIPRAQFDRAMTASSYVKYKDSKGNEYIVYSPYKGGAISVNELTKLTNL